MEGRYVNYFEIGHNAFEFILDFGQFYDGEAKASLHSRIVTSPVYVKTLVGMIQRALRQYEASYGRVEEQDEAKDAADRQESTGRDRGLKII